METTYLSLAEKISSGICIDSLPYVDKEYDEPGMQERVDSLIQEEMKTFRPRNYLADWPVPELNFDSNPGLKDEWDRVRERKPLNGFDVNKYTLEEPSGENEYDPSAWEESIKVARMQLEYQKEKFENLELLEKFGGNAWKRHNDTLDAMIEKLDNDLSEIQEKTQVINQKRKFDQERSFEKLNSMEGQILELQMKNYQMTKTCDAMEQQIKRQKLNELRIC